MATVFWGALIVLVSVLLASIGQILVQRLVPLPTRKLSTNSTTAIYAALYVMFGVSLALSLFLAWSEFADAQSATETEAGNVRSIYRLAGQLREPEGGQIQELVESYARVVVEEEWPLIGRGSESQPSPQAETLIKDLEESIVGFEPSTSGEQSLHTHLLTSVDDLRDDRQVRLFESNRSLPSIVWVVLIIGGILNIAFTFLLAVEPPWFHRLTTAALTVLAVLVLFTIYNLEYPFTGDVRVEPDAFKLVLDEIEGSRNP